MPFFAQADDGGSLIAKRQTCEGKTFPHISAKLNIDEWRSLICFEMEGGLADFPYIIDTQIMNSTIYTVGPKTFIRGSFKSSDRLVSYLRHLSENSISGSEISNYSIDVYLVDQNGQRLPVESWIDFESESENNFLLSNFGDFLKTRGKLTCGMIPILQQSTFNEERHIVSLGFSIKIDLGECKISK